MSDLTAIIDRQALADVMSTYAACIDDRDDGRYRALFRDDVEVVGFQREAMKGVEAWVAFVNAQLDRFQTTQHMLGPLLTKIDGDRADARTDLQATHWMREPEGSVFTLWGTYETEMVRDPTGEHGWKISRHALVRRGTEGP